MLIYAISASFDEAHPLHEYSIHCLFSLFVKMAEEGKVSKVLKYILFVFNLLYWVSIENIAANVLMCVLYATSA